MLFDSHAHLDHKKFDVDRDRLIESLPKHDVDYVCNVGADIESSRASVALADKYDHVYAIIGIHPHTADTMTPEVLEELKELAKHPKVVAIGEIGLDYYYDNSPRDIQMMAFRMQIQLAKQLDLPIVIHSRDATKDTFDTLKELATDYPVLMHCYSDSVEVAREYLKLGFHISLAGPVTFKNARVPIEVAEEVPLDRLLIETDCPYLTPEPHRGKRNEPMFVKHTAKKIAEIKGVTLEEVAAATKENAMKFFRIKE